MSSAQAGSVPTASNVVITMSRQGPKKDMLLPIGDSSVIVKLGAIVSWVADPELASEGTLRFRFRDGRSPFGPDHMSVENNQLFPVSHGGFFTYDVILTKSSGATEVFHGGGAVETKPKGF